MAQASLDESLVVSNDVTHTNLGEAKPNATTSTIKGFFSRKPKNTEENVDIACKILSLTSNSKFDRYGDYETFEVLPITYKDARVHLEAYRQKCDSKEEWTALVEHTKTLVKLSKNERVSGLETILVMHALLNVPRGERAALVDLLGPFLPELEVRTHPSLINLVSTHIPAEQRKAVLEGAATFNFESVYSHRHVSSALRFSELLVRSETEAGMGDKTMVELKEWIQMPPTVRAYALTASSLLLHVCKGDKVPSRFVSVFAKHQEHASRFHHVAQQMVSVLLDEDRIHLRMAARVNEREGRLIHNESRSQMFDFSLRLDLMTPTAPPPYEDQGSGIPQNKV
jgi:hypothetical protein